MPSHGIEDCKIVYCSVTLNDSQDARERPRILKCIAAGSLGVDRDFRTDGQVEDVAEFRNGSGGVKACAIAARGVMRLSSFEQVG